MSSVGFRSGVSGEMCVYIDLDGKCLFHNIQRELLLLHADSDDDFYHSAHLKYFKNKLNYEAHNRYSVKSRNHHLFWYFQIVLFPLNL